MSESRAIIRVFLASPGDLADERRAAKEAVDEVNATTAKPQGYQIDLYGWEDTISAAGRPQAIINEELKQCELFIGMLWAKWGTPPDNDGRFSSGFEEEFTLATEKHLSEGSPEMRVYFKTVEETRLKDPGPELSKVLKFRDKLIAEKSVLFENFDSTAEYTRKLRIGLAQYVNQKRIRETISGEETETPASIEITVSAREQSPDVEQIAPLTQAEFLESFADKLRSSSTPDSISAVEIARLRLAAMARSSTSNDEPEMGPHDANLIYRHKDDLELEQSEIRKLADFGLAAVGSQNKPLWKWLTMTSEVSLDWLLSETWSNRPLERKGAFEVARLGHFDILQTKILTRDQIVRYWLKREDVEAQKDALRYLKEFGNDQDYVAVFERLEGAPGTTSQNYLETVLAIKLRYDLTEASQLMVRSPFDILEGALMRDVLKGFSHLSADDLNLAIEHRNAEVREKGLSELDKRKIASAELGRRFADDGDLRVRQVALAIIERHEGELTLAEIEKILVKHKRLGSGFLGGLGGGFDSEGLRAFEGEKSERMARRSLLQLRAIITNGEPDDEFAYFALAKRDFGDMAGRLRRNFDNRFVQYFEAEIEATEKRLGTSQNAKDLIERLRGTDTFARRKYMRKALSILVWHSEPQDLARIRAAIDDESVDIKKEDIAYLSKHGDWSDIDRLTKMAEMRTDERGGLLGIGRSLSVDAAKAIYAIGRSRFTELIALTLPPHLMSTILHEATQAQIRSLADVELARLMLSENDELRKAIALKTVLSVGRRRARKLLEEHLSGERYYYNIVYWLDLVVAFPDAQAKAMANRALAT